MAIVFTKELVPNKLLFGFNNNIIRFNSNSTLIPTTAEINGLGINIILYPSPDGSFYFNFKEYISAILNVDNFKDDMDMPTGTYMHDWTDRLYRFLPVYLKINFSNETNETFTISTNWLSAYVQQDEYKYTYPLNNLSDIFVLTPLKKNKNPKIKYWKGYPFDFSVYFFNSDNFTITNIETSNYLELGGQGIITRFIISNGYQEIPNLIKIGQNTLTFSNPDSTFTVELEKTIPNCDNKHYIKWINRYGGWNYWLFNKGKKSLIPKGLGEINNDFDNIEDTISPTVNIGVASKKSISLHADVNEDDILLLSDLAESPKVYLFTGQSNVISSYINWIEVNVKDKAVEIQNNKYNHFNVRLDIDLPLRTIRAI